MTFEEAKTKAAELVKWMDSYQKENGGQRLIDCDITMALFIKIEELERRCGELSDRISLGNLSTGGR